MTMLLSSQLFPIAALGNVVEIVLPILFAILYIVNQLLTARKQAPKEGRPPKLEVHPPGDPQGKLEGRAGPDGRAGQDGRGAGEPVGLEAALRKEVDEFLQRTKRKKRQQDGQFGDKPASPRPGRRQPQQAGSSLSNRKTIRREATRPRAAESPAREDRSTAPSTISASLPSSTGGASAGTLAKPLASNLRSQSVRAHVTAHIDHSSQAIGQHAERLGDSLEVTSEQTQRRIEQKFDHQVGDLIHQKKAVQAQGEGLAKDVADLLRSPEGMRQLIIANVILNRPVY